MLKENFKMTELLKVLYEANSLGIWLWVQDNTLKFKSPEGIDASEIMAKLKEHKIEILNLLKENKVFSDRFLQPKIYRVNTKTSTLSFAQERLWFIEQYEGGTNAYHMPAVFELAAGTNTEGIKYAIQQIVSRHEILRSTIEQGDSQQSLQVVHETSLDIEEVQVAENDDFQNLLKEEINRPFDLSSEYPIRVKIYRIQPRRVILLVNTHHIASDGWSMVIFIRELFAFYKAYLNHDTTFSLPAIEVQYKDYALWQKNYLTGAVLSKQLEYWKKKLGGYQPLELPTDYIRPSQTNYAGSAQVFTLNKNISDSLRGLAQRYGVTLHTVLLSSVNILLSKYTGQDDIVIGSPIANRHHRQTEGLIGFFVNTQANRTLLNKSQTYEGLIQQVHQDQRAAQLHQDLPFERLVDELKVERDLSRHPVFQVLFDVQNFSHDNETIDEQKKYFKPFQGSGNYKIEKFDLSILIKDDQEELKGIISYATSLFCKDTIARLVDHYLYLLDQLTKAPQKPYSQFSLLLPEQYNKIIYQWNETDRDYPRKKTLHELFLEQAEKTPDNIALVYEDQKLTYRELNEKSNQLARHIQRQYKKKTGQDITPDTLIALCLDRSLEMVIGIMAVLKAGGAYVPIDPSYPQERIEYLLTDTQTKLVLSQRRHAESNNIQLPEDNVLYVELSEKLYTETDAADLPSLSSSTDLAYVIYTSGTTGKPKGVMVEHRSVYNTIHDLYDIYGKAVKVTAYTSYVFDVSVSEIFASLLQGLELHILADKIRMDSVALSDYFIDNEINLVYLPPVLLGQLPKRNYPNLKSLIYAGEPCDKHIAQLWAPSVKLYNYYGPTETSIYATCKEIISDEVDQIGRPLQNTKAYVLDSNNAPVPIGATGELYISGAGLARGYLNNKELTAERFIPNAYATEADKANGYTRLYKTGDLVRWLADGNLQYIGRNDDQIKIRGYRIELGEIENALTEIADIKQSCVLAKERKTEAGSTKYLVGYYVLDSNAAYILTPEVILEKLSTVLPDYMIPAALVAMDSFPLTINGKLDKLALPDPDLQTSAQHYVSPTTEKEILLSSLWQEVLGLEKVGVTDDFFKIGGNSILAIQVSHKMSKALGYDVRVADIFKKKTISQLLLQSIGQKQISIPKNETNTSVLSFAQERLWFIEQYERGTNAYHMPAIFELVPTIDIEGIKYAINQIVSRHQILRSTIQQGSNQQGIQVVHEQLLSIDEIQLTDKDDYQALLKKEINHPFDLRSEYPIRVKVFRIQSQDVENVANRTILVVNTHHIANDGWSIGVFQRELLAFYKAYIHHDTTFSLPPLEIQYADYARWQRTYLTGEELANQLNYWKDKLAGYQTLELPTDYIRPSQIDYTGSVQGFTLNKNLSNSLRGLAQQYGATLHSVLLSGLNILLSKYTGQNDIIVGSPIANRHHRQTEELIGFFVNIQVNRTQVDRAQSYEELIQLVHQQQIETQSHQDLPFEKLVDELEVGRDTLRHPVFQVAFVVQNFSHGGKATDEQRKYFKPFQGSVRYEVEKFDLSIFISDNQEELKGHISYATSLFHKDTIARLVNHYIHLLDQLTQSPRKPYSQFSLLLPEEYDKIVYRLNETGQDYPKDKTIYEIFQEQVRKAPDNIALVYEEQKLTYQELHEKSNQLARHLRDQYKKKTKQDLAPDTLIALCLDKSLEMVVAILAVLKAGGAYVPIDPSYPQERIDYLLADTKAALVLTQRGCSENYRIQLPKDKVVYVELSEKLYHETDTANLPSHSRASDLAYVIYTSGTTGAPKGVMIEHASVNNLVFVQRNTVDINSGSKVLQFASLVFDASVWEIFSALCSGAELYIIPTSLRQDAHLVSEYIVGRKITVALLPPVLVGTMSSTVLQDLQTLLVGGDLSSLDLMAKWSKGRRLINAYGPTENTVCATMHHYAEGDSNTNIGRALNNVSLYVLDNTLAPVPIGVTGELYIGGASIARGYLNNKELTAERFITNPFATETDKAKGLTRLYKTGDLVRWLADGNLEYVGRNDDQVKIRGYRIELGEIEHALAQVPGIKQSCVLVKERKTESGSTKYLVGYYVLDRNHVPEKNSDILDSWENLYDSEYEKGIEEKEIEIEADFSGWNSYITAEPIPLPEMRAWRDDIVALIRSLDPENVLEIGVGSGLLMYPLVKDVQRYVGLDISQSVITRHRKYFENQNYNVELYHLKADQLDKLPVDEVFDTIIVNSVCQYFPSIRYFEEMLEKAINRLSKTGSIFLGDIRNYDLHKTLIKEKLEFKGEHYGQHDIDGIFLKENELLISPSYFVDLKNRHKHLRVDVLKREGSYTNELSKYRYDVIISTNIERTIRNQIKISGGESDDFYLTKSINHYNIPFLNQLSKEDILKQLSKVLPDYMVPSTLLTMESFPLTINGKLDKRALPDPGLQASEQHYVAPATETEIELCSLWKKVLELEKVGVTDDFFKIGGNSILAIQVSHKMSKALGCDVRVADIFKHKTIAQLLLHGIGQAQVSIPKSETNTSVLSFAQERLWFIEQYEQGTNAYHMPSVFELTADANLEGIKYALRQIVNRHQILRSTIDHGDDQQGIQVVHEQFLLIDEIQLSDKDDYQTLLKEDINRPFDLKSEYPIRVKFYKIHPQRLEGESVNGRILLLVNTHHIASDGWSIGIFQRELLAFYNAYLNNDSTFSLPALEIQYKDYARWQKTYLTGEVLTNQLNYWKNKIVGYQTLELPTDYARPSQINYTGSVQGFALNKNLSDSLRSLAQGCGVTLHTVLLSGINILLSKYTGQDDIIVGSPIANRHHQQTEGLIGFFVNAQANRTLLSKSQSYEELIQQVHQDQIAAQLHQDLPFEKLVDELKVERDTSRHPVFQVMFDVQSFKQDSRTNDEQGKYFKPFQGSVRYEVEKFDLSIFISDNQEELKGHISYATSLFHKDTIARLVNHYIHLLDQLTQSPRKPYSQFSLLLPEEYDKIVYRLNETGQDYPKDKTIYEIFQEQVRKAPDNIALVYEEQKLTYQELHEKSNQLARHLRDQYKKKTKQDLAPDTLIALCLDKSLEMVVAILAVLKAGGAYVPIDPSYPQERIDYLLADTKAALVLTQRGCSENYRIQLPKDKVVYVELSEKLYHETDTANLPSHSRASDLAYVIYTSGTTGAPKGVMIEHASVNNLVFVQRNTVDINSGSKVLQFASLVFDASVWEIFSALCSGAELYIIPTSLRQDAHLVSEYIVGRKITVALLPPVLVGTMSSTVLQDLQTLLVGGDLSSLDLMAKWSKGRRLINAYGPTENTVCATMHHYAEGDSNTNIGRALNNVSLYVLDNTLAPVPIGVTGELYIGGASIARGYLNNKELTAERFITNPFATETDKAKGLTRLYKTGDLVRWLSDGNLEYVGRNDDQVKIRGYRIELGEIENALAQIAGIEQSCVLAKERKTESGSTKYLVGYYVLDTAKILTQEVIQEKLSTVLPEYMVPTAFVAMDSFPLTINGKLDKRALPDPDVNSGEEGYVAPTTDLEIRLCDIYAEVLGLSGDQIGTHQNFFKIGGNSILTMQLKNKLNQLPEFKHTGVADLFKYNTIHKLIESAQRENETVYKLQPVTRNNNHEVAIIGVSGAFSGANNIDELWQLIANQKEGIHFFSKDECKQLQVDEALLANANYVPVAGKVADIEQFDPLFWGLSPNEAKLLDPQIRKFIEHCWFVLESSGYAQQRKNHNIGVFAGSGNGTYWQKHIVNGESAENIDKWEAMISNNKDALATKTAFLLGFIRSSQFY
jgi:amino acid adenylation domain-containing protein